MTWLFISIWVGGCFVTLIFLGFLQWPDMDDEFGASLIAAIVWPLAMIIMILWAVRRLGVAIREKYPLHDD